MTTDVAWIESGDENLLDIGAEAHAIDRPVDDTGRGQPVATQRRQKRESLAHRPKGVLATRRSPLGSGHECASCLVLAQVSSMNTSRLGSIVADGPSSAHAAWRRPAGPVRRREGLFKRHAFMLEKMPKRIVADDQAAIGQFLEQSAQRQVGLLGDPRQNPSLSRAPQGKACGRPFSSAAGLPNRAMALRPLHDAGDADHERRGHRPAGLTRRHRRNHPLPQSKE